jgi:hypothetical protein
MNKMKINLNRFHTRLDNFNNKDITDSMMMDQSMFNNFSSFGSASVKLNESLEKLKENPALSSFLTHAIAHLALHPTDSEDIAHFLMGKTNYLPARISPQFKFDAKTRPVSNNIRKMLYNLLRVHRYRLFGKREAPEKTIAKLQALCINIHGASHKDRKKRFEQSFLKDDHGSYGDHELEADNSDIYINSIIENNNSKYKSSAKSILYTQSNKNEYYTFNKKHYKK